MTLVLPSACPFCGAVHDAVTHVTGPDAVPKDGDLGICIECNQVCVYTADAQRREPTDADRAEWGDEVHRTLALMQEASRKVREKKQ